MRKVKMLTDYRYFHNAGDVVDVYQPDDETPRGNYLDEAKAQQLVNADRAEWIEEAKKQDEIPAMSWLKKEIQEFADNHDIEYAANDTKEDLLTKIEEEGYEVL